MPDVYTEVGRVRLSDREMVLYKVLAEDRFKVYTMEELARRLSWSLREVGSVARSLRAAFHANGLAMVHNVWGVGYCLEERPVR